MSNFLVCFNAVFPIFLIICVGYVSRCVGIIKRESIPIFNAIAFKIFFPVMLFNNIAKSDLSTAIRPKLLLFSAIVCFGMFFLSVIIAMATTKNKADVGVVAQGMFRTNTAAVGIPIASSLCAGQDTSAVAVLLAIVVPLFNILSVICLETFNGKKVSISKVIVGVAKNPLIIGCFAGVLSLLLGIRLPKVVDSAVVSMAAVGSPLMLFALGAFIRFDTLKEYSKELTVVCFSRLILLPGIILFIAYFLGFRGVEFAGLIGMFATSTALNSFTMAEQMGANADLTGGIVISTSALCSFTIVIWCYIFKTLGVF